MGQEASKQVTRVTDKKEFQSISNFHPGYIQRLKERFELAKESFTLDREDLKELFNSSKRESDIIFEHFDQDGDGVIDQYEFTTGLAFLAHGSLEEKATLIFQLYDFDKSQYISKDELTILMTNSLTALRALEKGPAPSIEEIETKTDEFFRKSDTDGNERVTLDEFTSFIRRDPDVLKCLIGYGIAKTEDLGQDVGDGGELFYDSDLERECVEAAGEPTPKREGAKYGIDFSIEEEDDGSQVEQKAGQGMQAWDATAESMKPTGYAPSPLDRECPDASLELEYVYGYRCHDARDNLRYTQAGRVVFHAAGVGVVLNQESNTQEFMLEHDDDILCLATDPTGQFCATGQVGRHPWICVWDTATMECLARYKAPLTKGIKSVAFSSDGELVVAAGLDDDHSIAIFAWKQTNNGQHTGAIASGKGPRSTLWSIGFTPDNSKVVATCTREVNFYSFDQGVLKCSKGTGWTKPPGAVLCQAFVGDTLYTGCHDGSIVQWAGESAGAVTLAHDGGPVYVLAARRAGTNPGLISGGKDGTIVVWNLVGGKLSKDRTCDLRHPDVKSLNPQVKSVCEHPKAGQILVGTRGGEIVEFGASQGEKAKVFLKSHYDKELWGLAPHPKLPEFLTVGQDGVLGVWDIAARRQVRYARLECGADTVAYNNEGTRIAIGMRNGYLLVVDEKFAPVAKTQHSKTGKAITVIRFSPNDELCAVGGQDGRVRLYETKSKFRKAKVIKKNTSPITHLDFSADGEYLVTNSESQEVLFFQTADGKHVSPAGLKDRKWATWTCTQGWPVKGIYPANSSGADVNACARSPDGAVLATGDDCGRVNLFRFPCPQPFATSRQAIGHSAQVTNVGFSQAADGVGECLLSTGGADQCVFQWQYRFHREVADDTAAGQGGHGAIGMDEVDEATRPRAPYANDEDALALKPFQAAVQQSTPQGYQPGPKAAQAPTGNLRLKHAHGFRSRGTQGNLKYTKDGRVIYSTASLGVVLDPSTGNQEFFGLHKDDVISLAIHPGGQIAASGGRAPFSRTKLVDVYVWDIASQEVLARLSGFHRGGIGCLQFSPNGTKLLTIGQDEQHSVAVYDWANQILLSATKSGVDQVFDASWKNDQQFMTAGSRHVQFFTLAGKNLISEKGIVSNKRSRIQQHRCCLYAFRQTRCLTGNQSGELLEWSEHPNGGKALANMLPAHQGAIWQVICIEDGTKLVTGGSDCQLILWDEKLNLLTKIDLNTISSVRPEVRALDFNETTKTFAVGTSGSEVLAVTALAQKQGTLVQGHYSSSANSELWGAACHPTEQLFVTCGGDKRVRIWSHSKQLAMSDELDEELFAVDWSPCGSYLAVGDAKGQVRTLDAKNLKVQSTLGHKSKAAGKNAWVEAVRFSPDGRFVAWGVHGGASLVEVANTDSKTFKLRHEASIDAGLTQGLVQLDWSADSALLSVVSEAHELVFVDVNSKQKAEPSKVSGVQWATRSCKFGHDVQGIWPGTGYAAVNGAARSNSGQVLATAEEGGMVKVFRYPCTVEGAAAKESRGHGSHVTRVVFSAQDEYVISLGGSDQTVLVWSTDFGAAGNNVAVEDDSAAAVDQGLAAEIEENLTDESRAEKARWKAERRDAAQRAAKQALGEKRGGGMDGGPLKGADEEADEFLNARPWRAQIKAPSGYTKPPKNQTKPPHIRAAIDWVYGYKGYKTRNNVKYLVDGSVAYHVAGLGVIYDQATHTQRHFDRHGEEITAIAYSSDRRTIATGDLGKRPKIIVWDALSMQVIQEFRGQLQHGVKSLAFSPSGKLLAAVDSSEDNRVAVFNVPQGMCVAVAKGDRSQIVDINFGSDALLATAGVGHLNFWSVGQSLTSRPAAWGAQSDRALACVIYVGAQALTGTASGQLLKWSAEGACVNANAPPLHQGVLEALCVAGPRLITGGRDQVVNVLDSSSLSVVFSFSLADFGSLNGQARAIDLDPSGKSMIIGTFGCEIYQVPVEGKGLSATEKPKALVQGHHAPKLKDTNEVWGLCAIPGTDQFISVSDDATLRVWSASTRELVSVQDLNRHHDGRPLPLDATTKELQPAAQARCVDVNVGGQYCAVGFRSGRFRIYDMQNDWKFEANRKEPMEDWLEDIKFSPNNQFIAVASHDKKVHVFAFKTCDHFWTSTASSSFVSHLDWTADSRFLRTNDGAYELLFYDVEAKQEISSKDGPTALRDAEWHTATCPITWGTQGIWAKGIDGAEINHCDRSQFSHPDGYQLLATGDDFGKVKVFRYPSMVEPSQYLELRGHSSHVTKVKFGSVPGPNNTHYLFSTGGNDSAVIQWKLEM